MVYLHNRILHSRKKEFLPFKIAWIELENTMLSEISQAMKDKYHMISLFKESNEQNKLMSQTEPESWEYGAD